jgi:hypothetical protein
MNSHITPFEPKAVPNSAAVTTTFSLMIKPCPPSGEGVHSWLFHAACCAVEAGISDDQAAQEIEALMTRLPNPPTEIEDALRAARGTRSRPSNVWPLVNDEQVEAIVQDGIRVLDFWQASPFEMRAGENQAEDAIDILFPRNPWLCVGQSARVFRTQRREKWRGRLGKYALIVPSTMTNETGLTKTGRESCHSLYNTGPRRFLIIEADRGDLDQQAAVIGHLGSYVPLAAVVFSGSRSLHGWFVCKGASEEKLLRFMRYAVSLGADKRMWLRSQFCRMPDGQRSDGKTSTALSSCGLNGIPAGRQALIYLDPNVIR